MSKHVVLTFAVLMCAGCARSETVVLKPYALADGKMYQDVVTVAADETGTAPVVTHSKTFEIRTGYKGGPSRSEPVATASGTSPGLISTLSSAAVSSIIPAATGAAIATSGWSRSRTNISNNNQ